MQYRVWIRRKTLALESFVVEADNETEADEFARQAAAQSVWQKPAVQLKVIEVEPMSYGDVAAKKRAEATLKKHH